MTPTWRSSTIVAMLVAAAAGCEASRTSSPLLADTEGPNGIHAFDEATWSLPVRLEGPVNDPLSNEQGPALSHDGLSLYFCSNRPPSRGNDLWVSRRAGPDDPWGEPVNLGLTVNSTAGDCGPSLSEDGRLLFFTSARLPSAGGNDLYMSQREDPTDDLSWSTPTRLGDEINTELTEFSPFITRFRGDDCDDGCDSESADLYFERVSPTTAADIYVVRITPAGVALGPATPIEDVNSSNADGRPTVRVDGREMILHSNRDGRAGNTDLFVSTRPTRHHPWSTPRPLDELNTPGAHEIHPFLSGDRRVVFFVRGTGVSNDIWMATRKPGHE